MSRKILKVNDDAIIFWKVCHRLPDREIAKMYGCSITYINKRVRGMKLWDSFPGLKRRVLSVRRIGKKKVVLNREASSVLGALERKEKKEGGWKKCESGGWPPRKHFTEVLPVESHGIIAQFLSDLLMLDKVAKMRGKRVDVGYFIHVYRKILLDGKFDEDRVENLFDNEADRDLRSDHGCL